MNRITSLAATSVAALERFDHPSECSDLPRAEEVAAGYAVNIVERGCFWIEVGSHRWLATPGMWFCTSPGFTFVCEHLGGDCTDVCLTVALSPSLGDSAFDPRDWPTSRLPVLPSSNRRRYAALRLASAMPHESLELEGAVVDAVAAISDRSTTHSTHLYRSRQLEWYAARISRVRERLDTEFFDHHTLAGLARDVAMSPYHLARVFRELTGVPPHQYLLRRRIDEAARLTRQGASARAAGLAVGFVSASHFTTTYRRLRGVTPTVDRGRRTAAVPRHW